MNVNDILTGISHMDELGCMDMIYIHLEQIVEEDEAFMQLLIKKCGNAEITWEIPWYQNFYSITRPVKSIEYQSETFRTDSFNKEENDRLKKNWRKFIKKYDVPDKLICLARWRTKGRSKAPQAPEERTRRFVVTYLARGLQRTLYQVFRHIMTYIGCPVKGAYSPEEEKLMKICFQHSPNNAVTVLSKVLGREPRALYNRLQQMFEGKPVKKRISWTLSMATKFVKLLMKYSGLSLEELKNARIDISVWKQLEKEFDHNYIYLQAFWLDRLHTQLYVKKSMKRITLRRMVFEKLKQSSYQIWSDIRWRELVKEFPDGFTYRFLYHLTRVVIRPRIFLRTKTLQELVEFGMRRLVHMQFSNKRLRTLAFNENNELEPIRYHKTAKNKNCIDVNNE